MTEVIRVLVRETCVQRDGEWTPDTYMWYNISDVVSSSIREGVMQVLNGEGITYGFPLSNVLMWRHANEE